MKYLHLMKSLVRGPQIRQKERFNNFLNTTNLLHLGFVGPRYTWTNCKEAGHMIRTRIDRAYTNTSWIVVFPKRKIMHLDLITQITIPSS